MYIGMDVHKDMCKIAYIDEDGELVEAKEVKTSLKNIDELARETQKDVKIVMEASSASKPIYKHLKKLGFEVHMANPRKVRLIATAKKKTDEEDSIILAQMLRLNYLPECYVPDEDVEAVRTLIRHRVNLGHKITIVKNQIHALITTNGISHEFSDLFGVQGLRFLRKLKLSPSEQLVLNSLLQELGFIREEIDMVEAKLAEIGKEDKRVKLLMTIPGVNYYSALAIISEIGDINRFPNAKKLTAYAGLVPRVYQSGKKEIHGHITKEGPPILRWILVSDANAAIKWQNGKLKRTYTRLAKRIGKKKAIVAIARRLLIIIYNMLRKGEEYEERNDDLTYRKLNRIARMAKPRVYNEIFVENRKKLKEKGLEMLNKEVVNII